MPHLIRLKFIPLVLIAIGLYVYQNSLDGPFIFDDLASIRDNSSIQHLWQAWDVMSIPSKSAVAGRPVTNLSLAISYAMSGPHVWSYHVFNLGIHILAALTLYGVIRRTLGQIFQNNHLLAFVIALFWMIHPLQTESVDYIIQRTELLMGFFFLLTLYCFIRSIHSPRYYYWYIAVLVSCVLGMGSKETMVVAPLLILLYDRIFISQSFREAWKQRRKLYIGLAATWVILFFFVINGQARTGVAGLAFKSLTPWDYAKAQSGIILHYLKLTFWPQPLILDYYDWPISQAIPSALIILGLLGGTLWALYRYKWLGFLGAWFFLTLAPTSSFLPITTEIAAERRMYLPLAAVIAWAVVSGNIIFNRFSLNRNHSSYYLKTGFVVIIAVVLGSATIRRNKDYQSAVLIWQDVVDKRPGNARAHHNLGYALANEGKLEDGIIHYRQALRIKPDYAKVYYNLGITLEVQGKTEEAITSYKKALQMEPNDATAHYHLGNALAVQTRFEEAMGCYYKAISLKPEYAEAYHHLGIVLYNQERIKEAIRYYQKAIELKPNYQDAHYNLGIALAKGGQFKDALLHLRKARQIEVQVKGK